MVRSPLAVVTAILLVALLSLLAGWRSLIPAGLGIWLPLTGFLLGCIIMGVVSRLRAAHVVLIAVAIYVGALVVVTFIDFSWSSVVLGPIELGAVADSWTGLASTVFQMIPLLGIFQTLALMASGWSGETIVQRLIFNLVAWLLFGLIGFALAGLGAFLSRRSSLHVVTAPEVTHADESTEISSMVASTEAKTSKRSSSASPPPTPPPVTAELPASPAPSAQAIAALKGKGADRLKSTGQEVPAGQSRCPHCHATIIPGSTYCNSCQKQIA